MTYIPNESRYEKDMQYRKVGNSGLVLPAISLGLWQNFGSINDFKTGREILHYAFDNGITHFDLANNYGPPAGSSEERFGQYLKKDFMSYRDELIISSKAGWDMWPGPYGGPTGTRKHIIASCDQSLRRMNLDYLDIFYSHRVDPNTPLEETMGALTQLYRQGKALYIGISSYSPELTRKAEKILREDKVPLFIHQPNYSMLNRAIEDGLLDTLEELGTGCIAFSPLAQGMLTSKYLNGTPLDTRAEYNKSLSKMMLREENIQKIKALNIIAEHRGQTLAQMAIAWVLRDKRVTSALIGARNIEQLSDSLKSLKNLEFSNEELIEIDKYAKDGDVDLWKISSHIK
ncbi:MAG: L-glyceraldehyde 3-phosphate reductase [Oleiphilaceae bacterium]|jgi:L-glyceraldehyde 3-phosphate reductase